MKILLALSLVLGFSSSLLAGEINVTISNVKSTKGQMVFAVFDSEAKYKKMNNPKYSGRIKVNREQNGFVITDVPNGEYTILVYQDENSDGELKKNFFGPREPYGFSRNPKITTSAPKYKDVVFKVSNETPVILDIKLKDPFLG